MEQGRIISREPGLTVVELSGTPHGRGLAHGRLLGPEIALMRARLLAYLASISRGVGGRAILWFFGFLSRRMEPHVPEWLKEEMRGIAEGSGQSYRFVFLLNSLDDVMVNVASCSSFAVGPELSDEGKLIIGRNLDYPLFYDTLPRLTTVFKVRPEGGQAFVSVAWPGFAAVVTGMNESGLFLADLTSISHDRRLSGTPALLLNRLAVESSRTLDEMADTLRRARRTVGKNLMAASPEGARVIEMSARNFSARAASDGLLVCTNHYEDPRMAARQGRVGTPPKSDFPESYYSYAFSKERMETLRMLMEGRKAGVKEVMDALGTDPVANRSTVQSVVFVPADRRLFVARREATPVSRGEFRELTGILSE